MFSEVTQGSIKPAPTPVTPASHSAARPPAPTANPASVSR